jgi:hypothetical protein
MKVVDPVKSLKDYMHVTGQSTSVGGYYIRRDYEHLEAWVEADLVWVQDLEVYPDYVLVCPYEPIGFAKRPDVQN